MILSSSGNIPQARLFKSNRGTQSCVFFSPPLQAFSQTCLDPLFAIDKGRKPRPKFKLNLLNANFVYILNKYDINPKYNIDKVRGLVHSKARPLYQHQDGRR